MRILIDGDACPQKEDILKIAHQYFIDVILFIDYAHEVDMNRYQKVIYCDVDRDSVDSQIVKRVKENDLVITQDYGLAGLILSKKAKVLHLSGKMINENNIDELLFSRYASSKMRKMNKHLKGPNKRTEEDKKRFLNQLERILKENE